MPLCTQADIDATLQIGITTNPDPAVDIIIALAQGLIEGAAGRELEAVSVTAEQFSGRGSSVIFLEFWPITSITEIRENGIALTAADYRVDTDTGMVYRMSGASSIAWARGVLNIEADYDGGFPTTHPLFQQARALCVAVCVRAFRIGAAFANSPAAPIKRVQLEGSDEIEYAPVATSPDPAVFLTRDELDQARALLGPRLA